MKKTLLFSALLALLPASAFSQTAPTGPGQAPVVTTTTTTKIQPPAVQAPAVQAPAVQAPAVQAPAGSLTPTPSSSSNAVNALQQTLTTQGQPNVQVVVQPQAPAQPQATVQEVPELTLPNFATTDESTLLKEASKYQAQLAFLNMLSKIDKARLDMERERLRFEADKLKAEEEKAKLIATPALPAVSMTTSTSSYPASYSQGVSVAQDFGISAVPPVIRSIYSYDGQYFAEILTGSHKTIAKIGTKLPDGSKVVAIENGVVVVSVNGKRVTLSVDTSASGLASSQGMSSSVVPSPRPASLPPMPPSAD